MDVSVLQKVLAAQLCLTLCDQWTIALQAPLSIEFFRQEHQSELAFPSAGDLPNPGIEPRHPALQAEQEAISLFSGTLLAQQLVAATSS